VNACVKPAATDAVLAGTIVIDFNVTAVVPVTVKVSAGLVMPLNEAVMLVAPAATPVAVPPAAIVATVGVEEVQVTLLVRFCVLASLKVPVAVNAAVPFTATDGEAGLMAMDCSTGGVTVSVAPGSLATAPCEAMMVALPAALPVATPDALTAAAVLEELQVRPVSAFELPSLNFPVALKDVVLPATTVAEEGDTVMDCSVAVVAPPEPPELDPVPVPNSRTVRS
jgi:hypothetical protein